MREEKVMREKRKENKRGEEERRERQVMGDERRGNKREYEQGRA